MSSFIARAQSFLTGTPFPVPELDHFVDVVGVPRANVNAVAGAGIAVGDGVSRFLPRFPVRRDQVASFLARTLAAAHDAALIAPAGGSAALVSAGGLTPRSRHLGPPDHGPRDRNG